MSALEFCYQVLQDENNIPLPTTVNDFGEEHFMLAFGYENMLRYWRD